MQFLDAYCVTGKIQSRIRSIPRTTGSCRKDEREKRKEKRRKREKEIRKRKRVLDPVAVTSRDGPRTSAVPLQSENPAQSGPPSPPEARLKNRARGHHRVVVPAPLACPLVASRSLAISVQNDRSYEDGDRPAIERATSATSTRSALPCFLILSFSVVVFCN